MKRTLSIILSLTLVICSVFVVSTVFPSIFADSLNVFNNGDFEGTNNLIQTADNSIDTSNWYRKNAGTPYALGTTTPGSTEQAHSGSKSIKVSGTNSKNGYYKYSFYKNFAVETNAEYEITYYYKMTVVGNGASFRSSVAATSKYEPNSSDIAPLGSTEGTVTVASAVTGDWVKVTSKFNAGNNTMLRLLLQVYLSQDGETTVYVDDIFVKKLSSGQPTSNAIFNNGDFEGNNSAIQSGNDTTNTVNWYRGNSTSFAVGKTEAGSTDEAHSGTKSFKLSANPATSGYKYMFFKNFNVKKNTNYSITFYYKMTAANGDFRAEVSTKVDTETNSGHLAPMAGDGNTLVCNKVTDGWVSITRKFNSGNNETLRLILGLYKPSTTLETTVYIDDITVTELQPDIEDKLLIKNHSFEYGSENWGGAGTQAISVTDEEFFDGGHSLKLNNGNYSKAYQAFNCVANTDYVVSFKVYAPKVSWAAKWGVVKSAGQSLDKGKDGVIHSATFTNNSEWKDIVVKFNSGNNTKLYLEFQTYTDSLIYIDDVYVILADKIVLNGSFETETVAWAVDSNAFTVAKDVAQNESCSLHACGGYYSKATQTIAVEPNCNYEFSFYYKGKLDISIPNYAISHTEANFKESNLIKMGTLTSSETWKKVSLLFNTGENENVSVLFQCGTGCDFYIDNVVVAKTQSKVEPTVSGVTPSMVEYHTSTRYVCGSDKNLISDNGFENGNGNWNVQSLINSNLKVVDYGNAVSGNKVLKFQANDLKNGVWSTFFVDVEPNTDYVFSAWVLGERWSDTNKNDMTFGVIDSNTGYFLPEGSDTVGKWMNASFQLYPRAWDEEWHITGITFNSGTATQVGIAVYGANSTAYFDDLYLCKLDDAVVYTVSERTKANAEIVDLEPQNASCEEKDNLFENYDLSDTSSDYWQTGSIFGKQVTIQDSKGSKGNALHYSPISEYPHRIYYIKWIDVEANTNYTFSASLEILKSGDAFFGFINGNKVLPSDIVRFNTDESEFDENYAWKTVKVTFNTKDYTRIGFVICDCGGEFFLDNLRLFKETNGIKLDENDTSNRNITSDKYQISGEIISRVKPNTVATDFISAINEKGNIKIYDADGNEIDYSSIVSTDMEIRLVDGYEIKKRLKVSVIGDVVPNGKIDNLDVSDVLKHLVKNPQLSDLYALSADIDNDGDITIHDAVLMNSYINGSYSIK